MLFTRVSKTRVWGTKGHNLTIEKGNQPVSEGCRKLLSLNFWGEDGKKYSLTLYGDDIEFL